MDITMIPVNELVESDGTEKILIRFEDEKGIDLLVGGRYYLLSDFKSAADKILAEFKIELDIKNAPPLVRPTKEAPITMTEAQIDSKIAELNVAEATAASIEN